MARTESKVFQVHPADEQALIDFMQQFHWSLLSSQDITTIDNYLQKWGNTIYQVRNAHRYVKLTFSRQLDLPHLAKIKQLEQEFFSLSEVEYPNKLPEKMQILLGLVIIGSVVLFGANETGLLVGAVLAGCVYLPFYYRIYKPQEQHAEAQEEAIEQRREQILKELQQYN